jgi:hypothetical protein
MFLNFARYFPDSNEYIEFALKGYSSSPGAIGASVELRFALPYLAALLSRILPSLSLSTSFAILNCIFWGGGVVVAYLIGKELAGRVFGFCCGLFFTTSVPILSYGAAVLTDCAGYFFVGLGLVFVLRSVRSTRTKSFLEGAALTVGGFFHPSAFLALLYNMLYRLTLRRKVLWVSLVPIALVIVGVILGPVQRILSSFVDVFLAYSSPQSHQPGPAVLAALSWTFLDISTPFRYLATLVGVASRLTVIVSTLSVVWFVVVFTIGAWKSSRRSLLGSYLLALLAFPLVAPVFIERYLFVLWPSMVVLLVSGIGEVGRVAAYVMRALVRKLHGPKGTVLREVLANPSFYAIVYILLQGLANTLAILSILGPSPFKF